MTSPRFRTIDIKAFRGLRDIRLDGLSQVNIIAGKNNAGKTSALEAIAACCHPVDGKSWLDMIMRRGSRKSLDEQFSWLFPHSTDGSTNDLDLVYERAGNPSHWRIAGRLQSQREIVIPDESYDIYNPLASPTGNVMRVGLSLDPIGPEVDTRLHAQCEFELRGGKVIPTVKSTEDVPTMSVMGVTHRSEAFQVAGMAYVDSPHLRESLLSLLKNFDPGVEGVEVYDPTGSQSSVRIWHQRTGPTPISVFGDGFRRILTYALSLLRCRDGGVLLIDEIETAIHYSALRETYEWLVRACEEYNVQLFATTHSLEAIDALLDASPETLDTTYFRIFDLGQGSRVIKFSETQLRTLRHELGNEVRG